MYINIVELRYNFILNKCVVRMLSRKVKMRFNCYFMRYIIRIFLCYYNNKGFYSNFFLDYV